MLEFRPVTTEDVSRSHSTKISAVIKSEKNDARHIETDPDVVSEAPYELDRTDDNPFIEDKLFYKSTHIKLAFPIVNVFLAGIHLDAISKLINTSFDVYDLSKGTAILDISPNKDGNVIPKSLLPNKISNKEVYDPYKHLVGGKAISYLLNRINIEQEISKCLTKVCNSMFTSSVRKELPGGNVGEIVKDSGDLWVLDEYYINMNDLKLLEPMKAKLGDVRDKLLSGDDSKGIFLPRITVLLSFRDDPSKFKDMVQDVLPILPYGFRPTIDKVKDPLSVLYNRVIQANNDLSNSLLTTGCRLDVVRLKFATLYRKYLNLVYEKSRYDDDKFKPLLDILTGKYGVIRNNVQSSTIDFSGRSVITVDPNMSMDTIGIPEDMALQLCELDAIKEFKHSGKNKAPALEGKFREAMVKKAKLILEGSYIILGRQPTLYRLGLQAFKVIVVKGYSIILNPIITPAFNADFDGDQMYANMPQSFGAREEARRLMANVNNIFLPRDGSCHIAPRQEMIYGLYKCYHANSDESSRTVSYTNDNQFREKIIDDLKMQECVIDDKCVVNGKTYRSVGYAALKIFLGNEKLQSTRLGLIPITSDESKAEKCVTENFFREVFKHVRLNYSVNTFVQMVNRIVKLGFTVANLYAPDIGVLKVIDTSDIKADFEKRTSTREDYYNLGFDTEESFSLFYSSEYNKLESAVLDRVKSQLGPDNGYIQLIESGARGSKSNLLQLFGMKGTILKNQAEAFNAIIKKPLAEQLTGFEHFITAYGSRQGIIDKVIGTYAPGYLSRKMQHVCRHVHVVSDDCGTTDGLLLTYDFLKKMYGTSNLTGVDEIDYFTIKNYTVPILNTRFVVGGGPNPLTMESADDVFMSMIASFDGSGIVRHEGVKMRSPITCKDQCCTKCYGIDLGTQKLAVKGTPVGYDAGTSIGEPITQLIMKNFQKGGVAGVANLTSSFDAISDLLEMYSVSKGESKDIPIIHDYIAPVKGHIRTVSRGDGSAVLNIVDSKGINKLREKVYVYEVIKLKEYVNVGDSIQKIEGILDVNEILKYRGVDEAQMYMLFQAYNIFVNEVFVNFKHFELLVSGMTYFLCTRGNDIFKTGNYYSLKEHTINDTAGCEFTKVLRGLKQAVKVRNDFLSSLYLEDVNRTVTRNIITSGVDELKDPFVRITLGLTAGIGTEDPSYIEMRGV